jgi:hypothetical protein
MSGRGSSELPREIILLRDQRWRRKRDLRLRTPGEARRFVRRVGYCLFWPTEGIELPNLLHAIAGNARPLAAGYNDSSIGRSWTWKDEALDKRWWYYGKLLRRRATLVSLALLPAFYALSENYGDPEDYLIEYREGRLSAEAKGVYEALLTEGPLDTIRLRQAARLTAPNAKSRFDRALVDLQAGLKVLPVGVAEAGAWNYAFVYDLVDRWYPDLDSKARALSTRDARQAILAKLLENLIVASPGVIRRALGWTPSEIERTVDLLVERRKAARVVDGVSGRNWVATRRGAAAARRFLAGNRSGRKGRRRRRTD